MSMDRQCLDHVLSSRERDQFQRDGYLIVENALSASVVDDLLTLADQIDRDGRASSGADTDARMNHYDVIGKNPRLLDLIDLPTTFAKVWGLLGWNIQLYHTHLTVNPTPPRGKTIESDGLEFGWHQDSGQINIDLETSPRPRVSLKVGYFLSDTSEPERGNLYVLPGSHLKDDCPGTDRRALPDGAVPVCVAPGTAVIFDRRIWHSGSANYWHRPRRVLFYGYSYRWLRPRDDMQVAHYLPDCDPIRRQLLGASATGGRGYTSPTAEDVPLKAWMEAKEA
jgi:ectoine hydroxylase